MKMKESEAWMQVAENFACNTPEGGSWLMGLCFEYCIVQDLPIAYLKLRVIEYLNNGDVYAYPYRSEYNEARALAAIWLSLEAEEEENNETV